MSTDRLQALQVLVPYGDALLATDQANVAFATGVTSMADSVYGDASFWTVIARDALQVVVSSMEVPAALEHFDAAMLSPYGSFPIAGAPELDELMSTGRTQVEAVAQALRALEVEGSVIADPALSATAADALRALLGHDRLELDGSRFERARSCKDDEAIACLERANRLVEVAIEEALDNAEVGSTERELAARVQERIIAGGGRPTLHVVGVGRRSALPEAWPSDHALAIGDPIRFDVGCTVDGWHADFSRTAVCGEPSEWLAGAHDAIVSGQDAALAAIRPGVAVSEVYQRAVAATRGAGLPDYARAHCGHGIGLSVYEGFMVAPSDPAVLREGNVLCVETPHYDLARGGVQVEDAVVVTTDGCRRLGTLRRELLAVGDRAHV